MLLLIPCLVSGIWFYLNLHKAGKNRFECWLWACFGFALFFIFYVFFSLVIAEVFDASSETLAGVIIAALIVSSIILFVSGRYVHMFLPRDFSAESMKNSSNQALLVSAITRTIIGAVLIIIFFIVGGFVGDEYDISFRGNDDFDTGVAFSLTIVGMLYYYITARFLYTVAKLKRTVVVSLILLITVTSAYLYVTTTFWLMFFGFEALPGFR
jgi:hypothetical protein